MVDEGRNVSRFDGAQCDKSHSFSTYPRNESLKRCSAVSQKAADVAGNNMLYVVEGGLCVVI